MSGRFFTAALFMSVILLVRRVEQSSTLEKWIWVGAVLFLGLLMAPIKPFSNPVEGDLTTFDTSSGIADERVGYYRYTNILALHRDLSLPLRPKTDFTKGLSGNDQAVIEDKGIGMLGYYAGPRVHIIDLLGLADPLLARLPTKDTQEWRIGHFERNIPDGYVETIKSKQNQFTDPYIAQYYDDLHLIISGNLWSLKRWGAIWRMNTGQDNYLIDHYMRESR